MTPAHFFRLANASFGESQDGPWAVWYGVPLAGVDASRILSYAYINNFHGRCVTMGTMGSGGVAVKRCLVTGANGYIGCHVVNSLLNEGAEVIACDLNLDGLDPRAKRTSVQIFSDAPDLFQQLGSPDVLVHMAWMDGFVHNSSKHMFQLSDHMKFLARMVEGGLKRISVMGTMHEIGYWEGAITADTPCNPQSQYGVAKNAMRQSLMMSLAQAGVSLRWLRAYYIVSNDARGSNIFSKIVKAAQEGKTTFPFTTGMNLYDFIDIELLGDMIAICSLQDEVDGVINVCTGEPESLSSRVERFIQANGFSIQLEYGAFPDRPYDSPGVWGDATQIHAIMERWKKAHT